tara:strand:+ start:583 stop:1095 length:513 start_codon:yes stop_codon:yes gene_type:complete
MSLNDISISRRHLYSLLSVFILLFAVACEDENEEDPDHTDADGFVLETEDGVQAYKEFKGAVTGSVSLSVGDTLHFMVHFLDHDGEEIGHDDHDDHGHDDHGDDEDGVRVSGANASVAVVEMIEEEHDGHEEKLLQVVGVAKGITSFKLELMHGDHADYTSTNNVPVTVN